MSCTKHGYVTEREARAALVGILIRRYAGSRERRAYRCHKCAFWHLTSRPLLTPIEGGLA